MRACSALWWQKRDIVDPDRASLERYVLGADGFGVPVRLTVDDIFTSPLFPDLTLECREFFLAMTRAPCQ